MQWGLAADGGWKMTYREQYRIAYQDRNADTVHITNCPFGVFGGKVNECPYGGCQACWNTEMEVSAQAEPQHAD